MGALGSGVSPGPDSPPPHTKGAGAAGERYDLHDSSLKIVVLGTYLHREHLRRGVMLNVTEDCHVARGGHCDSGLLF